MGEFDGNFVPQGETLDHNLEGKCQTLWVCQILPWGTLLTGTLGLKIKTRVQLQESNLQRRLSNIAVYSESLHLTLSTVAVC